jgi:hypothetical protein
MLTVIAVLSVFGLHASKAESMVLAPNGSVNMTSNSTQAFHVIPYDGRIWGYVIDSKGNGAPQAFVTLYNNGTQVRTNPVFSGNGTGIPMGQYQFTGLAPGNYSVMAEIANGMQFFNGTAQYVLAINESKMLNVTISGYVVAPWLIPTPAPTVEVQPTPLPQPSTVLPSLPAKNEPMIPVYVYTMAFVLAIIVIVIIWLLWRHNNKRAPAAKSDYPGSMSSQKAWSVNTHSANIRDNMPMLNTSKTFRTNIDYRHDIENLNYESVMNDYTDIAVINRVDRLAKKYSVDQVTIFQDLKVTRYRRY